MYLKFWRRPHISVIVHVGSVFILGFVKSSIWSWSNNNCWTIYCFVHYVHPLAMFCFYSKSYSQFNEKYMQLISKPHYYILSTYRLDGIIIVLYACNVQKPSNGECFTANELSSSCKLFVTSVISRWVPLTKKIVYCDVCCCNVYLD